MLLLAVTYRQRMKPNNKYGLTDRDSHCPTHFPKYDIDVEEGQPSGCSWIQRHRQGMILSNMGWLPDLFQYTIMLEDTLVLSHMAKEWY